MRARRHNQFGSTLIEVLVAAGVFSIVGISIYQATIMSMRFIGASRQKVTAAALSNERMEIVRNLPYKDVGLVSGWPAGKIQPDVDVVRDGKRFHIKTIVRNIDDPFDGVIGGTPNDTSPADYKLVEQEISCPDCQDFKTLTFSTWVAPNSLEASSTNGAVFARVLNALGEPVIGAAVHIENTDVSPDIIIDDVTDNNGMYQLVDVPAGVQSYVITVTKAGMSTERTYKTGGSIAHPTKANATVQGGKLTQLTFGIDTLGSLNVSSVTDTCAFVPSLDFTLKGAKVIGTSPTVYKYDVNQNTDGSGLLALSGMEWDTYDADVTDSAYQLIGTIPLMPLALNPGASQDVKLITAPVSSRRVLVVIRDAATGQPLSDASVRLVRSASSYDVTLMTGRGAITQTDWSDGPGHETYAGDASFFSSDSGVNHSVVGQLSLTRTSGIFATAGILESATFDLGSTASFRQVSWKPTSQPSQVGTDSVRVQVAANTDATTWDFVGPDGTSSTYYTTTAADLWSGLDGNRYFRYRIFLSTNNTAYTPTMSDLTFSFTTDCLPPGQVDFSGLTSNSNYRLYVTRSGYASISNKRINPATNWMRVTVDMTAN